MAGLGFLIATVVSLGVGAFAIRFGKRVGVVDLPDQDLKPHAGTPVPLGGVGILIGTHAGLAVAGVFDMALLIASVLVWSIGLIDDLFGLSPVTRLLGAAVSGTVLVVLSDNVTDAAMSVFWVVAVVVVINAVNLFDGLDGLAGSVTAISFFGIIWFGVAKGVGDAWTIVVIVGALLGFLVWNRPKAKLFLGDNGSYLLGLLLVWAALFSSTDRMGGLVAVGLVGLPLIDLGVTILRRGLSGLPLFKGDRDHTYDRFYHAGYSELAIASGFSAVQVIWVIVVVSVALFYGDLPAAITALALGLGVAGFVGVSMTVTQH